MLQATATPNANETARELKLQLENMICTLRHATRAVSIIARNRTTPRCRSSGCSATSRPTRTTCTTFIETGSWPTGERAGFQTR